MDSCTFVPASSLGLSNQGWEDINSSSNITFGDANRTLYTPYRLLTQVEFEDALDEAVIQKELDKDTEYIDLEN